MPQTPTITIVSAQSSAEFDQIRALFEEYAHHLQADLSFQHFEHDIDNLPGDYAQPSGELLLALVDGAPAGCCALRPLPDVEYVNAAEMKCLFVRPAFRRFGLGRLLSEATLEAAELAGYQYVLLDTLNEMESARTLYQDLGFTEIPPYYHNPVAGAHYLMATIGH